MDDLDELQELLLLHNFEQDGQPKLKEIAGILKDGYHQLPSIRGFSTKIGNSWSIVKWDPFIEQHVMIHSSGEWSFYEAKSFEETQRPEFNTLKGILNLKIPEIDKELEKIEKSEMKAKEKLFNIQNSFEERQLLRESILKYIKDSL